MSILSHMAESEHLHSHTRLLRVRNHDENKAASDKVQVRPLHDEQNPGPDEQNRRHGQQNQANLQHIGCHARCAAVSYSQPSEPAEKHRNASQLNPDTSSYLLYFRRDGAHRVVTEVKKCLLRKRRWMMYLHTQPKPFPFFQKEKHCVSLHETLPLCSLHYRILM